MIKRMSLVHSLIVTGLAVGFAPALSAALIIEQTLDGFSSGTVFAGQAFVPNDAVDESTSISPTPFPDPIDLVEFTVFRGNDGDPGQVFLNIYSSLSGGSIGGFVGSSAVVDWNASNPGEAVVFTFDNLTLDPDTQYFAALSTTAVSGDIVSTRMRGQGGNPYAGGGVVLNNSNGTITEGANNDLRFEAVFVIPEPGSMSLLVTGLALVGLRKRRSTNA
ncbi:MAG: PEP-CTERM sorting domain-containing protein [Planctomycetota bacterium]